MHHLIIRRVFLSPLCAALATLLISQPASAQDEAGSFYETRFVRAGDIRLQYHDFGGSGLPVIFVQDFHDYFGAASDPRWPPFLARFADQYRVLAPVRRGWGESDDTGWGYDVATQAEDLLAFMDALGIERAVLVGRMPADQDLTWIAEHHPERLAGLIYLHSLHVPPDDSNSLIRAFTEAYSTVACDMRDPVAQVGARSPWRPHFLGDETVRIDVPALRFFETGIDDISMNLRRLDRVADIAASPSECATRGAKEYFVDLAADEERQAELRQALLETDLSQALDRAMQRAFGENLRTIRPPELDGYRATLDFLYQYMQTFLEGVDRLTSAHSQRSGASLGTAANGYQTRPTPPHTDGVLRVLVYHDMEGLSGQDDWRTYLFRFPEQYRRGQELLAADVNAVIDGLFAGGADEVHVVDFHGSGNPAPDLRADLLDPRAEQVLRDEPFDVYTGLVETDVYDAVAVVGMHAKSGSGGYASHTRTPGVQLLLDGRSITETELVAFSWGRVGVPVIFASGDDVLREDLSTMPWVEYVTVKEAVSADSARLRPVEETRAELREGAKRAVESLSRMRFMRPGAPLNGAVRAVPPADLSALEGLGLPGISYDDGQVSFVAPDFQAAYDGLLAMSRVAEAGYVGALFETLDEHPAGEEIMNAAWDRFYALWFAVESGRWSPPPPEPDERRKYHGSHE